MVPRLVHGWTYRAENVFLLCRLHRGDAAAPDYPRLRGDFEAELELRFSPGVDGVSTTSPTWRAHFLTGSR